MSGTALSVATMRQRLAAHITSTVADWSQSTWLFDQIPELPSHNGMHQRFAIGVETTDYTVTDDRQRSGGTTYVHTLVTVRWGYVLQTGNEVASFDAALDAEQLLVQAIRSCAGSAGPSVSIQETSRVLVGENTWVLGDIICISHHSVST